MEKNMRNHVWDQVLEDARVPEMTVADIDHVEDLIYNQTELYKREYKEAKTEGEEAEAFSHLAFWITAMHEWHARREELEQAEEETQ